MEHPLAVEFVIDPKTGRVRQAGATTTEGEFVLRFKRQAEQNLYLFAKAVLGRTYLTPSLHQPVCRFIQTCPPRRKLVLLPREHGKTSIVSHALPIHILLQPAEANIYFPGLDGADCRIILACETEMRATDHIRVIETAFESNALLRGLWPERCWEAPRKQSKKWNDRELIIPRQNEYPDPSVRGIGVGGAVTGAHPNVLIKDDLISVEAANSAIVMQTAIQWHVTSRALINDPAALEFIIGTRWAVGDLYQYIGENDPTVEIIRRSVVENGQPIYPEKFTLADVERLNAEFGVLFPLLYMNTAVDPSLVDFHTGDIREYALVGDQVRFDEDDRDIALQERYQLPLPADVSASRGVPLNRDTYRSIFDQRSFYRVYD